MRTYSVAVVHVRFRLIYGQRIFKVFGIITVVSLVLAKVLVVQSVWSMDCINGSQSALCQIGS